MTRIACLVAISCLALGGCAHDSGGFAPSSVPINGPYTAIGPAKGIDCLWRLFGILPVSGSNRTSNAVQEALDSVPGADALVNVSIDNWIHHWIVISDVCTEVRATAVTIP